MINRVIHLSTKRGLERRDKTLTLANYSIDEKSFRKGHSYVSVLSSPVAAVVIDVVENRTKEAVKKLISQGIPDFDKVETVSMDMWPAYLNTIKEKIPNANIIHDRFHLVKYLIKNKKKKRSKRTRRIKKHKVCSSKKPSESNR